MAAPAGHPEVVASHSETAAASHPDVVASHPEVATGDSEAVAAARRGDVAAVRLWLERGAPDTRRRTPSQSAVATVTRTSDAAAAQGARVTVLPGGSSPCSEGAVDAPSSGLDIPVEVAALARRGGNSEVLAWLDGGGRVNATIADGPVSGVTLLMLASAHGRDRLVEALLQRGAAVDQQNSFGTTALIAASERGGERVVHLLCGGGAAVDVPDSVGRTALMQAAVHGHAAVVEAPPPALRTTPSRSPSPRLPGAPRVGAAAARRVAQSRRPERSP